MTDKLAQDLNFFDETDLFGLLSEEFVTLVDKDHFRSFYFIGSSKNEFFKIYSDERFRQGTDFLLGLPLLESNYCRTKLNDEGEVDEILFFSDYTPELMRNLLRVVNNFEFVVFLLSEKKFIEEDIKKRASKFSFKSKLSHGRWIKNSSFLEFNCNILHGRLWLTRSSS